MAQSEAVSGVHSYLLYGKESTYNTAVTTNTHLGLITSFKPNINNNMIEQRGFAGSSTGGRSVVNYVAGVLELGGTIDFDVIRWNFLEFALGSVAGTYTYSEAAIPPSMTLSLNIDNPGSASTDQEQIYSGAVFDSVTVRSAVGEPVTASATFKASLLVVDTTLSSAVALPSETPFTFVGGAIELPTGSALSNIIDSVEFTINNNFEILTGVGSRLGRSALAKERSYSIKISLKYLSNALLTAALGATTPTATGTPTEYATLKLTYAVGARSCVLTFSGVPLSTFAHIGDLNKVIGEDLEFGAKTLSAVYTA